LPDLSDLFHVFSLLENGPNPVLVALKAVEALTTKRSVIVIK